MIRDQEQDSTIEAAHDVRHASHPRPAMMSATTLIGDDVCNSDNEDLGKIKDIMLDLRNGKIAYAVMSFGSFLGMGEKLAAVPWSALKLDAMNKRFVLDVEKEERQRCAGFR